MLRRKDETKPWLEQIIAELGAVFDICLSDRQIARVAMVEVGLVGASGRAQQLGTLARFAELIGAASGRGWATGEHVPTRSQWRSESDLRRSIGQRPHEPRWIAARVDFCAPLSIHRAESGQRGDGPFRAHPSRANVPIVFWGCALPLVDRRTRWWWWIASTPLTNCSLNPREGCGATVCGVRRLTFLVLVEPYTPSSSSHSGSTTYRFGRLNSIVETVGAPQRLWVFER